MPVAKDDIVLGWDVKCASRGKVLKSGMKKTRHASRSLQNVCVQRRMMILYLAGMGWGREGGQ
jgi:hypothetical protein